MDLDKCAKGCGDGAHLVSDIYLFERACGVRCIAIGIGIAKAAA
ncbi:hypothetical protein QZM22_20240 [Burkholderia oklahomensis]|nr:hypothetical protein [Burkholderia oklahomensis]MDN7674788.1 hypothetical protein [Burkholderia oklahomensis]